MRRLASACVLILACSTDNLPADTEQQNPQTGTPAAAGMAGNKASASSAGSGGTASAGRVSAASGGAGATGVGSAAAGADATKTPSAGQSAAAAGGGGSTSAGAGGSAAGASGAAGISAAAGSVATAGASGAQAGAGGMAGNAGGSSAAGAGGSASSAQTVEGCQGSTLLKVPDDTGVRGPWPIGSKTLKFGRFTNVEVFYPAEPGSEQGKPEIEYDMRLFLPERERQKVPDAEATIVKAKTYRDLPIDAAHGAYPVMIFVHGTASFRLRSLSSETLWASRGFVVMAADHPNLYLADYLGSNGCGSSVPALDLNGDVDSEIAALTSPKDDLAFLEGHIDMKRLALAGHSAGAYNVAQFSTKPGVQLVIALAGTRAVAPSSTLKSVLYAAGIEDSVLPYGPGGTGLGSILYPGSDTDAYNRSPGPSAVKKRLVGIAKAGHLNVVDGCAKNAMGKTGIDVAQDHGVCGASNVAPLADCGSIDANKAISITNEVMTAVMEETLQCQDRKAWISALMTRHPEVSDFHEAVD